MNKILMVCILASLTLLTNAQQKKVNLAGNGSFELPPKSGKIIGWPGPGVIDCETFTDGEKSLKIDSKGEKKFIYQIQAVPRGKLKPSTKYIFTVDIKRTTAKKGKIFAAVLEKAKKTDKTWTSTHSCGKQGQAGKWEHFGIKFTTGSSLASVVIILYNINTEGIVWFDNVSLVEAE